MAQPAESQGGPLIGRYALHGEIAAGGMATVHFGRLMGPAGFCRVVAIKRLHPQLAKEPEFVSMFFDEVRLAARIQHPNVVATLDAVDHEGELFLVMEYVHGESLSRLIRLARSRGAAISPRFAATILCGLLHGLHAAHEARSESNAPLEIVHRDVSPQNVMVGLDGIARVLDFGIAKAVGRLQTTREGQIKGKMAYLAPEHVRGGPVDRRSDVYGAAVVLWETLTGVRLFDGDNDAIVLAKVLASEVPPLSAFVDWVPPGLQAIVSRGLDRDPERRFATAREMALELHEQVGVVSPSELGDWVSDLAGANLAKRFDYLSELERHPVSEKIATRVPTAQRAASFATQERPVREPFAPSLPMAFAPLAPPANSSASSSPQISSRTDGFDVHKSPAATQRLGTYVPEPAASEVKLVMPSGATETVRHDVFAEHRATFQPVEPVSATLRGARRTSSPLQKRVGALLVAFSAIFAAIAIVLLFQSGRFAPPDADPSTANAAPLLPLPSPIGAAQAASASVKALTTTEPAPPAAPTPTTNPEGAHPEATPQVQGERTASPAPTAPGERTASPAPTAPKPATPRAPSSSAGATLNRSTLFKLAAPTPHVMPSTGPPNTALARPSCKPPYTVDAAGIKHFKVECL